MLVQMSFSEIMARTTLYQGHAMCSKCGTAVGPLGLDELQAMMSGRYGDVLCFDCEDFPPQPMERLPEKTSKILRELFKVQDLEDLPLHCWTYWSNPRLDVALQLSRNFGWCFWRLTPDEGKWQLCRVRLAASEAQIYKDTFILLPVRA